MVECIGNTNGVGTICIEIKTVSWSIFKNRCVINLTFERGDNALVFRLILPCSKFIIVL